MNEYTLDEHEYNYLIFILYKELKDKRIKHKQISTKIPVEEADHAFREINELRNKLIEHRNKLYNPQQIDEVMQ
jgi:hypothetical protein